MSRLDNIRVPGFVDVLRAVDIFLVVAWGMALTLGTMLFLSKYTSWYVLVGGGVGTLIGAVLTGAIPKFIKNRIAAGLILFLFFLVLVGLPVSSYRPGGIAYSSFGLTVVGACPVPVVDFAIRTDGLLRPRDKSHTVTVDEVRQLIDSGARHIVIGKGWDGQVQVDPAALEIEGVRIEVLVTPAAFGRYNELKEQGIPVALIAHTTC